ncbi:trk family potassium uptake protein [Coccidioides immitis RS]|uniref:Potassium transport protein n=1 Tax=Coccidioides immitis (strain RS) TaxID=246410 RepID=J3KHW4_COCIM|nr:trk family potassium uptake protein [Coccidioides immitis RS]EAS35498.3 trk family potassium uptake protein [Coccidioides immitis RS]
MWYPTLRMPHLNFIRIHYVYILALSIVGTIILYPIKNMRGIDAFFQAVSGSTVTGLNTVDLKEMRLYQQITVWFLPMLGNMCFVNVVVVYVRLHWFEKKFKDIVQLSRLPSSERSRAQLLSVSPKAQSSDDTAYPHNIRVLRPDPAHEEADMVNLRQRPAAKRDESSDSPTAEDQSPSSENNNAERPPVQPGHITFSSDTFDKPNRGKALRIPGPREFEKGYKVQEVDDEDDADMTKSIDDPFGAGPSDAYRKLPAMERLLSHAASFEHAASSAFIIGGSSRSRSRSRSRGPMNRVSSRGAATQALPYLSYNPTVGRNSKFLGLTEDQKEELGGIEYRSLRLLLKIAGGYYVIGHIIGAIGLIAWIWNSNPKYRDYVRGECAVNPTWWAFYSSMTTFNNLGFTLTPDSMISFRDSTFPMLWMTFLIYVGNTAYPCMLRLIIWIAFKLTPEGSSIKEPLNFLLDHPRRCYTVLFPSKVTWLLFGSLVLINGFDVILFLILDLHYPEVTAIQSGWHRFCAALFQTASARTTGTSSFAVANVHPAAQFSLMVMMYISVFPIALSVRGTNTYEESSLGIFDSTEELVEMKRTSYLGVHIKMQLAFDLWYVFLGVFVLAIAEGSKIADPNNPGFNMFSIFFEVISAYGNVGLSLGHPDVNTGLTGKFGIVGKLVICAMMIRGKHRGLPYEVDRAIILPGEKRIVEEDARIEAMSHNLSRRHTN